MSRKRRRSALWTYLDAAGILDAGDEAIAAAKREYWKEYHKKHRRSQRTTTPECVVSLSRDDGTHERIAEAAKRHKLTIPSFLRTAALAYIGTIYIVPDRNLVVYLEGLLASCRNDVAALASAKEKYSWQRDEKIEAVYKRIDRLEREVADLMQNPPSLEASLRKEVARSPEAKAHILSLLQSL